MQSKQKLSFHHIELIYLQYYSLPWKKYLDCFNFLAIFDYITIDGQGVRLLPID